MTTQLQFEIDRPAESQVRLLLTYLSDNRNEWVSMPDMVRRCGGYAVHSRVADLRKLGYPIENRVDRSTKPYKSFYKLFQP
jgi:hypothetical protein